LSRVRGYGYGRVSIDATDRFDTPPIKNTILGTHIHKEWPVFFFDLTMGRSMHLLTVHPKSLLAPKQLI